MSAYVNEFLKIAAEQQRSEWKKHLTNALLVGGGVGLGAGAGTLALRAMDEFAPEALKSPLLPVGVGLSAAAVKFLTDMREAEKQRRLQEGS